MCWCLCNVDVDDILYVDAGFNVNAVVDGAGADAGADAGIDVDIGNDVSVNIDTSVDVVVSMDSRVCCLLVFISAFIRLYSPTRNFCFVYPTTTTTIHLFALWFTSVFIIIHSKSLSISGGHLW